MTLHILYISHDIYTYLHDVYFTTVVESHLSVIKAEQYYWPRSGQNTLWPPEHGTRITIAGTWILVKVILYFWHFIHSHRWFPIFQGWPTRVLFTKIKIYLLLSWILIFFLYTFIKLKKMFLLYTTMKHR